MRGFEMQLCAQQGLPRTVVQIMGDPDPLCLAGCQYG